MCEEDESFVNDGLRQYASHVIQGLEARFPKESGSGVITVVFSVYCVMLGGTPSTQTGH